MQTHTIRMIQGW